ncbi:MAG: FAD-dependent oxidoreductase, partial [Desulfovibrio sp.]|nr:FAD-dependent oxidoreductase [Desulfovibrio sp.]MCA1986757.1 FAD-dependent oxidoreductase [Desulfovibrio sp.]
MVRPIASRPNFRYATLPFSANRIPRLESNVNTWDVIIVGAGPAGLFAAYQLCEHSDLKVLVLDKGHDIHKRACPIKKDGT